MELNGCVLLVPFPAQTRKRIEYLGFLWAVRGTKFDPVMSYVEFTRVEKVDWSGLDRHDQWRLYRFETCELYMLPEGATKPTRKRDYDGNVMSGRVLPERGFAVCVKRLMKAKEVRAAMYGRCESAGPVVVGSSAGSGQDPGIDVEGKEDWDLLDVPMESIKASARVCGWTLTRYASVVESLALRYLRTLIRFSA